MILVGNKSDIWQERQVVTDKACQVAKMKRMSRMMVLLTLTNLTMIIIHNFTRRRRRPAIPIILRSQLGRVLTRYDSVTIVLLLIFAKLPEPLFESSY